VTTCSTASNTWSQEVVWNASAVSFHENIRFGQGTLAVAPRDLFHDDRLAAAALDTPHQAQQKDQETPERNEFETVLRQLIVSGGGLMAPRAARRQSFARANGNLDALVTGTEAGVAETKPRKRWQRFRIVISSMARKPAEKTTTIKRAAGVLAGIERYST
jgi:hypothetical protein